MAATDGRKHEWVKINRLSGLPGLKLMRAAYVGHSFARHSHDGYAFGVIEDGALEFSYRGKTLVAPPGIINLVNPDEPHDGHGEGGKGWTYRMFYFDVDLFRRAASEICGKPAPLPFFRDGVIEDRRLASEIRALHIDLTEQPVGRLERESRLLRLLVNFIGRHADANFPLGRAGREHPAVLRAKRMIDDLFHDDLSLTALSTESGLSPFHLLRVFKAETGLTPHRYLSQVRVRHAEQLIREGVDLADAAYRVGFADQSHLNRQFKGITGVTPGAYRNFIQDADC